MLISETEDYILTHLIEEVTINTSTTLESIYETSRKGEAYSSAYNTGRHSAFKEVLALIEQLSKEVVAIQHNSKY